MTVLDNIAPIKEVRLKQRTEPWMTSEILEVIKARDSALYNFKKHKSNDYYKQFCNYRNKVQYLIKSTKASYFLDKVEEHKFDAKGLWQQLKKLGYKSKSKNNLNIVLNIENEVCYDPCINANHFNDFFYYSCIKSSK